MGAGYYELPGTREEYLALHYPEGDPLVALLGPSAPPLSERYPLALRRLWCARPSGLALDVGCACGGVTYDLARDHRAAVGVDLSRALLAAARSVRDAPRNARLALADALALPFRDGAFETVAVLNLIDRVPDPGRALDEAARVTAPGGMLLVGSPYTWKEEFTPRERWLGRVGDGGVAVRDRLGPHFALEAERDLLFFLPHHARSGQLGRTHVQVFRRQP